MTEFTGQCLCGAVRFAAEPPSIFCCHCHCRYCRQAHGAAFVTWVGFPETSVRVSSGADAVHWYQSSKQGQRGSCACCGTMMFYKSTISPGEIHVARACIPDAIDQEPGMHVFFDQKAAWVTINDGLPTLTSDDPLLAGFKAVEP